METVQVKTKPENEARGRVSKKKTLLRVQIEQIEHVQVTLRLTRYFKILPD